MSMTTTTSKYAQREPIRFGHSAERGISLVELVIAITVLAIGMAGLAVLFSTAIMNNSRSKGDTSGTMLTQTVLEQIAAQPANLVANLTLTDCNTAGATVWPIATTGAASPGAGATINVNTLFLRGLWPRPRRPAIKTRPSCLRHPSPCARSGDCDAK